MQLMGPRQLANTAWALGKLHYIDLEFFDTLIERTLQVLSHPNIQKNSWRNAVFCAAFEVLNVLELESGEIAGSFYIVYVYQCSCFPLH